MRRMIVAIALTFSSISVGCTATPVKPGGYQGEWKKSVEVVKDAGINALSIHGFEITKNEPMYIEGYRSRTWGFSVLLVARQPAFG